MHTSTLEYDLLLAREMFNFPNKASNQPQYEDQFVFSAHTIIYYCLNYHITKSGGAQCLENAGTPHKTLKSRYIAFV
jgi:hypothetical protein